MEQAVSGINISYFGAVISLAIIVAGAAFGISTLGSKALDSMARQPDIKNDARILMILGAALIEGVAFFAAVACLILIMTK
ncbi:MAG: ATP synthase F0 subunit C [Fibrobacter sp.]|jgi:F-type H+-transporting ATPase subunit c|nr:ATP synthase F0 subunit C [Fibrobacter sp.]